MPFRSRKQAAYMFANRDKLAKQGVDVKEWAAATNFKTLPARSAAGTSRAETTRGRKGNTK